MKNKFFKVIFMVFLLILSSRGNAADSVNQRMVGVYWGAFDPPTTAHHAIISKALTAGLFYKIIVVVNNHPYKNYTYSLQERLQLLKEMVGYEEDRVEFLWQDENNKVDYFPLKKMVKDTLCVIAGSDSYQHWIKYSTKEEREAYDAMAIVPRGDDYPSLVDANAFFMVIDPIYKYVSSTQVKQLGRQ